MGVESPLVPVAVLISGRTRAGKTSLAYGLHAALGWPVCAFGAYVRAEADARRIPPSRVELQELGARLIDELGPETFCRRVLVHGGIRGAPCILEGVRHITTLRALRRLLAPALLLHVHLVVSDGERDRRLAAEGIRAEEGARWETHSTERDVLVALPARADLIVCADRPRGEVLEVVTTRLAQL